VTLLAHFEPLLRTGNGTQWYINQGNFYRSVRNLVIDLRRMPASTVATGLHWQVSQATSLKNIVVEMSTAPGNQHQGDVLAVRDWLVEYALRIEFTGLFMENGSGGFMGGMCLGKMS
jgi:glucan 1,3-beta-glucosidase